MNGLAAWCRRPSLDEELGGRIVLQAVNELTGRVGLILLRHGVLTCDQLSPISSQNTWAPRYSSTDRRKVVGTIYNRDIFSDGVYCLMRQYLEKQRLVIKRLKANRDLESEK